MIEHIVNSSNLSMIIILTNPNNSYYFLDKYLCKINLKEVFENLDKYKGIISFIKEHFNMKYFKDEYLFSACKNGHLEVVSILLEKRSKHKCSKWSCSNIGKSIWTWQSFQNSFVKIII